jgi:hypothetical protein
MFGFVLLPERRARLSEEPIHLHYRTAPINDGKSSLLGRLEIRMEPSQLFHLPFGKYYTGDRFDERTA